MIIVLCQLTAAYALSWAFWRILRRYVVKTDLDNIPGPPSYSFWKGNFRRVFDVNGWDFHKEIAEKYGAVVRINAIFGEKQLYVFDPKALHHVIVKDQYIYEETEQFIEGNRVVFGNGLLSTLGDHHRKQRKMLNPIFSIAHMRQMVPTFYEVSHKLRVAIAREVSNGPRDVDMLKWMTRTALELVGQSGLGWSFEPMTEDAPHHPYSTSTKNLIPTTFRLFLARTYIFPFARKIGSPRFQRFIVNILPWKNLHRLRDIIDVLHNTSVEILESKKKALQEGDEVLAKQIGQGKDIMSILLRANMDASDEDRLSESEMLGQMSTLTFAAMDTTSGALSRILFLLAGHPKIQEKLREEVTLARRQHGDLPYDELTALPYLDAVCRETLRLYPPVSVVSRTTREDVVMPLSEPIRGLDGREISEITVPNNTNVIVSILGSNRNPAIWGPDSYKWKPERWLSPLPDTVTNAHIPGIYSNLMTFLGGGRACIGFKFSQLEMKTVLSILIETFRFEPSGKEIFWEMNGIATPTIAGDPSRRPQLPLRIVPV